MLYLEMGAKEKNQSENPQSDVKQKQAFAEFIKHVKGVDPDSVHQNVDDVDVVACIDGRKRYFEIKTSRKSEDELYEKGYFGAASLSEWNRAMKNLDDFYFVYIIGDEKKGYKYLMVKAEDILSYATVPPFAIYMNIKMRKFLSNFKALKDGEKIESIESEITQLPYKPRKPSQTSFGVNKTVIENLYDFYTKQKELYLQNERTK